MIRGVRLRRRVEWGAEESRQEPILRIPCETVIEELAAMVEREKESGLGDMESHCRVSVPSLLCVTCKSGTYGYTRSGWRVVGGGRGERGFSPTACRVLSTTVKIRT